MYQREALEHYLFPDTELLVKAGDKEYDNPFTTEDEDDDDKEKGESKWRGAKKRISALFKFSK